jgi:diguanylate cyclase (GGDEF)-like protein
VPEEARPVVMIVDDDPATLHLLNHALAHDGFSVVEAKNGHEAVDLYSESQPDVILMDVEMPGMDGYQACATIRHCKESAGVPIVMVTGHDDTESINRAYTVGATDFVSKPINWSLIGHRLRYILRGARNLQELKVSEAENRALITVFPDSIFLVDADGVILKHLSGERPSGDHGGGSLSGRELASLLPDEMGKDVVDSINSVLASGAIATIEYPVKAPDDHECWYESRFVHHGDNKVLVMLRDISERKRAERKIHTLAFYDSLTGLPNRSFLKDKIRINLSAAKSQGSALAVFNIDLNRFKRINDTLGSSTGDAVLVEIAARLSGYAEHSAEGESGHCLARIGGNDFFLLLSGMPEESDVSLIAEQLRNLIAKPLHLNGHEFVMTASIGIATFPESGASVDDLLKHAETARDKAKHLGSNTQTLYRSSMNAGVTKRLTLENELRRALEDNQLSMYYQPKYCTKTLQPQGAEALLRWFHPEQGEISPAAIISVAEESGLITDLGCWVASEVCEQISSWKYFGLAPGPIAINTSGQEFGRGDPVRTLTDAARKSGISASAMEVEITETVLMSDIHSVTQALHALREEGFTLAVDDFGTGYSSLRYLQKFPVDVLKIDSSFVRDVEKNSDSRAICAAIIALAQSLDLKIVGEGVESKWQHEFLRRQGCDTLQGFLLSKPLSPDDFADHLKRDSRPVRSDDAIVQLPLRA